MVVASLCAAVAYTISLTATNAVGTSPASAPSNPVVALPAQVPSAPLITSVFGRNAALLVSWSAPDDDGGSALTGYVLTATAGSQTVTVSPSASTTQTSVPGLSNGTVYNLALQATNAVGNSNAGTRLGHAPGGVPTRPGAEPLSRPDRIGWSKEHMVAAQRQRGRHDQRLPPHVSADGG